MYVKVAVDNDDKKAISSKLVDLEGKIDRMDKKLAQRRCMGGTKIKYALYQGTCYYFEGTNLAYEDAKANCQRLGGRLFEPRSVDVNDGDYALAMKTKPNPGKRYWIGVYRHGKSVALTSYQYESNRQRINSSLIAALNFDLPRTSRVFLGNRKAIKWQYDSCNTKRDSICEF